MVDGRVRSVGAYVMRLVGGIAVILGILGVFGSLPQGNLIGVALSIVFVVGGALLVKRAHRATGAKESNGRSRAIIGR